MISVDLLFQFIQLDTELQMALLNLPAGEFVSKMQAMKNLWDYGHVEHMETEQQEMFLHVISTFPATSEKSDFLSSMLYDFWQFKHQLQETLLMFPYQEFHDKKDQLIQLLHIDGGHVTDDQQAIILRAIQALPMKD